MFDVIIIGHVKVVRYFKDSIMFTIIQDTREKQGWDFSFFDCKGMKSQKLDEGDYSVEELLDIEDQTGRKIIRIERKASASELAINLGKKRKQFDAELHRLSEYEHKYLIFEFTLDNLLDFPNNAGLPNKVLYKRNKAGKRVKRIKMTGPFMASILHKIENEFDIEIIYAGDSHCAMQEAFKIMSDVYKENIDGN